MSIFRSLSLWVLLPVMAPSVLFGDELGLIVGPRRDVVVSPKANGVTELNISGATPHFWSQPVVPTAELSMLSFGYFSTTGLKSISVRYRNEAGEMIFAGSKPLPVSETFQPFAIELSQVPTHETRFHLSLKGRQGDEVRIRNFQLRTPTAGELAAKKNRAEILAKREADAVAILKQVRRADFPSEISRVTVGKDLIRIEGKSDEGNFRVSELLPHQPGHVKIKRERAPETSPVFPMTVPRFEPETGRDRALSRWRIDRGDGSEILSHAKWATDFERGVGREDLPKLSAKSQKGIGGVPVIGRDDHPIFELGVSHATVNVVLNAMLSDKRQPGREPVEFEGRTYFLNRKFMEAKDTTIRHLCGKDIIVTCILLVGNNRSTMGHPAAEARGTYAMPNLVTPEGARLYRAAIHVLAERYSKPEMRISNWVIHNEVDQAGTWTNMGDQPLARYLDHYMRSARIVFHTARLFDPHARVFVSLTHHWTKKSAGTGTYVVRDIVDLFTEMAVAGGEFPWGVAYHPYPRDLRNPDTWDDRDVTGDFDTPYITPKNLEVLPAYLGPDRPILLSEQGFNTPTLSELDQKRQVAGLIYTFRKLPKFPSIEAYHLHRFQDMPDREGGLRLGIMDENGNRKLGWHAYRAIGTDKVAEFEEIADEIIAGQRGEAAKPAVK